MGSIRPSKEQGQPHLTIGKHIRLPCIRIQGREDGEGNDPGRPVVVEIHEQGVRTLPVVAIDRDGAS
jgi:hypothetical protein